MNNSSAFARWIEIRDECRAHLYDCDECLRQDIDPDETAQHRVSRSYAPRLPNRWANATDIICQDCVLVCDACGDYITDDQADMGRKTRYRDFVLDGKLTPYMHAVCAARSILADLSGDGDFDPYFVDREVIATFAGLHENRGKL